MMSAPTVAGATEPVLTRITYTATGTPVTDPKILKELGAVPSEDPGWFWRRATPASAARMRHHGHLAVGSLTTTYMPFEVGAELQPGQSTCADYNDGNPHAPHRLAPATRALVCQGVRGYTPTALTYDTFCSCPDPLLTASDECLVCGTQWEAGQ